MIELYELAGRDPEVRFSPFCWRVRMALAHKGLDADAIAWHFGENTLPEGRTQVPVLVDDGDVISDSTAIAQHLEDAYENGPSLFGGETGEAHARFIVAWTDTVLQPAMLPILAPDLLPLIKPEAEAYFRRTREKRLGMTLERAAAQRTDQLDHVRGVLAPLRQAVAAAPFLGGEEQTYADYAVFGAFQWARCVSDLDMLESDDPVQAWRERMLDLFDGLARDAKTA